MHRKWVLAKGVLHRPDQEKTPQVDRDLLEEFFPGRDDVKRLLLEPISYANGSSFMDPAIAYGIVFTNFMRKGIYTFKDGTDSLVRKMVDELRKNGVELRPEFDSIFP